MLTAEGGICPGDTKTLKFPNCVAPALVFWTMTIRGQVVIQTASTGTFEFQIPDEPYQIDAKCCKPEDLEAN